KAFQCWVILRGDALPRLAAVGGVINAVARGYCYRVRVLRRLRHRAHRTPAHAFEQAPALAVVLADEDPAAVRLFVQIEQRFHADVNDSGLFAVEKNDRDGGARGFDAGANPRPPFPSVGRAEDLAVTRADPDPVGAAPVYGHRGHVAAERAGHLNHAVVIVVSRSLRDWPCEKDRTDQKK